MKYLTMLTLITFASSSFGQTPKHDPKPKAPKGVDRKSLLAGKIPGYQLKKIEGFDVLVSDEVIKNNDNSEWKRKPLDVLELELGTVARVLPKKVETVLRSVVVWVEWEDKDDPDFGRAVAKYYGLFGGNLAGWALSKNKHPGKANNVEIVDMKSLAKEHQPDQKFERCVLLHEFAHAVHFHIVGSNNQIVAQTFNKAMARDLYESAKDVNGRTIKPYARTNDHEYFAELTCCYINKLHYYPNTRDDLKSHDPDGFKLMEKVWGKGDKLDATIRSENDKAALRPALQSQSVGHRKEKARSETAAEQDRRILPKIPCRGGSKEAVGEVGRGDELICVTRIPIRGRFFGTLLNRLNLIHVMVIAMTLFILFLFLVPLISRVPR